MSAIDQETLWWIIFLGSIVIWDLVLRGYGMWRAAEHHDRNWFIALMLVNSAGILPLIYLGNHRD